MQRFDPPGFLDDMTEPQKAAWSQQVSAWLDRARVGNLTGNDGPRPQFFNPLTDPPSADAQRAVIAWNAFPRRVRSSSLSDKQRWRRADSDRNLQDEYCEWSVARDPVSGRITRVTLTCEGPEYWTSLAELNPQKVLDLYREFISPEVRRDDLFPNGRYAPKNAFNNNTSRGAMHLIQDANSLTAEIELGAAATIRRLRDGRELTGAQELIACSRYGDHGRNSDPFIGEQVNALARQGADITINNPVGLYLHEFNPVGWATPDGADPRDFWRGVRGRDGYRVRAVFEVPPGRGYFVGDIRIANRPIEFGAQIVDFVTIRLEGLATRIGLSAATPVAGCKSDAVAGAAGATMAAEQPDELAAAPLPSRWAEQAEQGVAELGVTGAAAASAAASADPSAAPAAPLLDYPPMPAALLETRLVAGAVMAYASPDSTYVVTRRLVDAAQRSIVIGIYDFSAVYMKEHLKRAMRRGVSVSLMLDTNPADDQTLFRELTELGAHCVKAPSRSAGSRNAYFGNAHEKIIVVDGEIVMIQSGNWSENSIPFNEGDGSVIGTTPFELGNRDMGLALQSTALANLFTQVVARDMRLSEGLAPEAAAAAAPAAAAAAPAGPSAGDTFFEAAPIRRPDRLFASLTVQPSQPIRVTPVLTPENFHPTILALLGRARRSIRIEQQYIRGHQPAVAALLQAIATSRQDNPELDVRIIVSPKYLEGPDRVRFLDAMKAFDLAFDENYRFLSLDHFVHCHNKLIVVDDDTVLLGSQNWSTTGLLTNREASLLVEHPGIAAYFARIFDADWAMSEPAAAMAGIAPAAAGLRAPSDFAGGGVVLSRAGDYRDV